MTLSVIVPAHQEEKYLGKCLDSLSKQDFNDYEIIVVANGCTDKTAELARKKGVKVIETSVAHVSKARNLGAKHAQGKQLIFMDADIVAPSNLLKNVNGLLNKEDCFGSVAAKPDNFHPLNHFWMFLRNFSFQLKISKSNNGLIFCNKSLFDSAGGFDDNLHLFEDRMFLRRAAKLASYKFINSDKITLSMRRYQEGHLKIGLFWFINRIKFKTNKELSEYKVLR